MKSPEPGTAIETNLNSLGVAGAARGDLRVVGIVEIHGPELIEASARTVEHLDHFIRCNPRGKRGATA